MFGQYKAVIDELRLQKIGLLERIKDANRNIVIRLANSIPESELSQWFTMAKKRNLYTGNAGILMIPTDMKKYDKLEFGRAADDPGKAKNFDFDWNLTRKENLQKKFTVDMGEMTSAEL